MSDNEQIFGDEEYEVVPEIILTEGAKEEFEKAIMPDGTTPKKAALTDKTNKSLRTGVFDRRKAAKEKRLENKLDKRLAKYNAKQEKIREFSNLIQGTDNIEEKAKNLEKAKNTSERLASLGVKIFDLEVKKARLKGKPKAILVKPQVTKESRFLSTIAKLGRKERRQTREDIRDEVERIMTEVGNENIDELNKLERDSMVSFVTGKVKENFNLTNSETIKVDDDFKLNETLETEKLDPPKFNLNETIQNDWQKLLNNTEKLKEAYRVANAPEPEQVKAAEPEQEQDNLAPAHPIASALNNYLDKKKQLEEYLKNGGNDAAIIADLEALVKDAARDVHELTNQELHQFKPSDKPLEEEEVLVQAAPPPELPKKDPVEETKQIDPRRVEEETLSRKEALDNYIKSRDTFNEYSALLWPLENAYNAGITKEQRLQNSFEKAEDLDKKAELERELEEQRLKNQAFDVAGLEEKQEKRDELQAALNVSKARVQIPEDYNPYVDRYEMSDILIDVFPEKFSNNSPNGRDFYDDEGNLNKEKLTDELVVNYMQDNVIELNNYFDQHPEYRDRYEHLSFNRQATIDERKGLDAEFLNANQERYDEVIKNNQRLSAERDIYREREAIKEQEAREERNAVERAKNQEARAKFNAEMDEIKAANRAKQAAKETNVWRERLNKAGYNYADESNETIDELLSSITPEHKESIIDKAERYDERAKTFRNVVFRKDDPDLDNKIRHETIISFVKAEMESEQQENKQGRTR